MNATIETSLIEGELGRSRRLAGKVGLITGGSTGMGLATAKRFAQEGMDHVFVTSRRRDVLETALAGIGDKATPVFRATSLTWPT